MLKYLKLLREQGVTADIVQMIQEDYGYELEQIKEKYERYKGTRKGVPIFMRSYDHEPFTDAQINNDFFGEIIDVKVGHFSGKAASYRYDAIRSEHAQASELLTRFQVVNHLAHIDSQTTKDAAICGKAYRLLYVDPEKEIRVTVLKPYEVVVLYEFEPTDIEFAFRIYQDESQDDIAIRVDVYDRNNMYEFIQKDGQFILLNQRKHLFYVCPVILYQNNDEELGDADKVLALIDAYDTTLSDMNAEISALRLAYLAVVGADIDEEGFNQAMRTGAFALPGATDIKFLVKNWNDSVIENHLNRLEQNIYQFSKTPNMRDESFSGNSSGVSLKYKLSNIEGKCLVFERKKVASDIRMFQVLATAWRKRDRIEFDAYSVIIEHHRNIPIDLNEIAEAVSKYVGILPMEIILTLMPFVDDPQYVLDLIEQEKEGMKSLDDEGGDFVEEQGITGQLPEETDGVAE